MTDRVTQDLATIARNAIDYIIQLERERNTLLQAIKTIADGPWPDDVISPIDQARFDERMARAAIKAVEAPCAASGCNYPQGECLGVCRA